MLFREEALDFFVPVLLPLAFLAEVVVVVETFAGDFLVLELWAVPLLALPLCAAAVDGITPPTAIAAATKPIQVALLNQ